jgi:hypothetical protein
MKKPESQQVLQAISCLLCVFITVCNTIDLSGTEFSGGWLTGPLLSLAEIGILLFVFALAMTFWYPRLAAALGIAASLLALPIHFYFIATVPFSEVFAPGHEFRLQPSAGFHWEKWTVIGVLALAAAFFLCVRRVAASFTLPVSREHRRVTAHTFPTLISALLALLLVAVPLFILKLHDQSVEVPQFTVSVKLSGAAAQRLQSINESVIVMASFEELGPMPEEGPGLFRGVDLGTESRPLGKTNVVEFKGARVPLRNWKRLSDKNYSIGIDAVSVGREPDARNILDCPYLTDRIESVKGRTVALSCSLEGESRR